jgi:hypothetical protein
MPASSNVDPLALPPDQHAVLMRFTTAVDGKPFIPALYRQLARWPGVLAWLAVTGPAIRLTRNRGRAHRDSDRRTCGRPGDRREPARGAGRPAAGP